MGKKQPLATYISQKEQAILWIMSYMHEYIDNVRSLGVRISRGIQDTRVYVYHGSVRDYESMVCIDIDTSNQSRINVGIYMIQDYIVGLYYTLYYVGGKSLDYEIIGLLLHVQSGRNAVYAIEKKMKLMIPVSGQK